MKQVLQSHQTGQSEVVDVPVPAVKQGHVLIRTRMTLISSGTERMAVEASRKSLFKQAIEQPERIKKAIDRVSSEGLLQTYDSIRARSDQLLPLGYCNVGDVVAVGEGATEFKPGDRVVSNGPHAEFVNIGKNLCAKIPDQVTDEDAVFTVLGAIALQGIRLLDPTLGECFAVIGLGSIGLLSVQILRANGCRVLALDFAEDRLKMAASYGAETIRLGQGVDPLRAAIGFSRGEGVDGVLIAAATDSNEPLHQAASICRRRGRIVLTGVIGPELSRADFYEKEISFQVSCSYGPGRYDASYEQKGIDYPLAYVRWTEQRNFVAFLDLLQSKNFSPHRLLSHRFPVERAQEAYAELSKGSSSLGIALTYSNQAYQAKEMSEVQLSQTASSLRVLNSAEKNPVVGFIGAGNYGGNVLLPAFRQTSAQLHRIADRGGLASWIAGRKNGVRFVSTDIEAALKDPETDTLVIATRHDTHADLICRALKARKNVFVEKPLAINEQQLREIETSHQALGSKPPQIMVGFNRRFAPHVMKIQELLKDRKEPLAMTMTVNAGMIPHSHWVHDVQAGGGRMIGEGCHFVDLMRAFARSPIQKIQAHRLGNSADGICDDKAVVILSFEDGSIGTLNYLANGHSSYPKEHMEIFCAGRVYEIQNFRKLRVFGHPGFHSNRLWRQDKGQRACVAAFVQALRLSSPSPIPLAELLEVTRATFQIAELLKQP